MAECASVFSGYYPYEASILTYAVTQAPYPPSLFCNAVTATCNSKSSVSFIVPVLFAYLNTTSL